MNVLPSLPYRDSRRARGFAASVAALGLVAATLSLGGVAAAGGPTVTICHATSSSNNPYITNHPSASGDLGGHNDHNGPVWTPTLVGPWGDIIPPFTYGSPPVPYPGKNWTTMGQEVWANSCNAVNPDLRLLKTSSGADVAGGTGSYFLNVKNIGTGTATGPLTVTDTFPAGVVATAVSGTSWTCDPVGAGASISCVYAGNLAPAASAPQLTVSVNWVTEGSKVNSASVTVVAGDPSPNNIGQNTTVISPTPPVLTPDLRMLKTSSGDAIAGETGSYFLNVKNVGTGNAVGPFTVTDTFPAGVVATVVSGTSWTCGAVGAGASISCVYSGNLAANGSAPQITVSVNWVTDGSKLNSAHVTELAGEPTPNNTGQNTTVISPTPPVLTPDLRLLKTSSGAATAGQTGSYFLNVKNIGTGNAVGPFTVTDTFPAGVVATAISGTSWTCDPVGAGASISCDFSGDLAADASAPQITVSVNWVTAGSKVNSAHVTELAGEPTANNTGQNTTNIAAAPLADPTANVVKTNDANGDEVFTANEEAAAVSQPVTFKLRVTNTSPYAINVGQAISDLVYLGVEPPSQETPSSTFSCLPAITDLAPQASADCYFTADSYAPADGVTKSNIATVTLTKSVQVGSLRRVRAAALVAGFTVSSNVSTVKTSVPPTRVTAVAPTVTASQCVGGAATAPSYTVPVTPGVVYSPAVGGVGVANTTTTVTATAAPGFVLTNPGASPFSVVFGPAASCRGNSPPPPPPPLPPAPPLPPVVVPPAPDGNVGVSKTGPGSAQPGDELVYTIDVTNVKGTPATAFTVTDVLPAGLAFSQATGTDFTCANAGQAVTCVYSGTLGVGQTSTIVVRALLDSAFAGKTIANTAIVDPGRADTDNADNTSTATTDISPLPAQPLAGGGGGEATGPVPTPIKGGGGGEAKGPAIPFTGAYSERMFQAGVSLLMLGLFLSLLARRRRVEGVAVGSE